MTNQSNPQITKDLTQQARQWLEDNGWVEHQNFYALASDEGMKITCSKGAALALYRLAKEMELVARINENIIWESAAGSVGYVRYWTIVERLDSLRKEQGGSHDV